MCWAGARTVCRSWSIGAFVDVFEEVPTSSSTIAPAPSSHPTCFLVSKAFPPQAARTTGKRTGVEQECTLGGEQPIRLRATTKTRSHREFEELERQRHKG